MSKAEKINNRFMENTHIPRKSKAIQARESAQRFVFSPMLFYSVSVSKQLGILDCLADSGDSGLDDNELLGRTSVNRYVLRLLLDSAISAEVVLYKNSRYSLSDMGYFILNDPMTGINFNFVRDVCYQAMPFLQQSLMERRPAGLQTLGNWSDVYQGLAHLPDGAQKSWFEFDHYYSDKMFSQALPVVFDRSVESLLDVGANTGRWAKRCLLHNANVDLTLVDLPSQLAMAKTYLDHSESRERITYHAMNVLEDDIDIDRQFNVVWMSQFLDCFDENGISRVLNNFSRCLAPAGRLIVVELFADRQYYPAATLSLNATSLYFCCVANGNSRFYQYPEFCELLNGAGYTIQRAMDFTSGHTALICTRGL